MLLTTRYTQPILHAQITSPAHPRGLFHLQPSFPPGAKPCLEIPIAPNCVNSPSPTDAVAPCPNSQTTSASATTTASNAATASTPRGPAARSVASSKPTS